MLFAFQAIVTGAHAKAPTAAKKAPTYRAPGVVVVFKTIKPMMARRKLNALM
jgi:hypothetical protein